MNENENLEIPDFSDPEFDNDKEVKKWREEEKAFAMYIDDCIQIVSGSFNASKSSHKNLKGFELHKVIDTPFIIESHSGSIGRKTVFFSIIQYHTSVRTGRTTSSGSDYYFVGVIILEKSYPHTIIQQETAALKIHNLFVPGDIDFKHARWFSFKFHVITKDEDKLRRLFENVDLERLTKFSNAEIEIKDNQCYFRTNRKPVSPEEAEIFTELAKTICEIL
jgi:hypothetical protein